MRIQHSFTIRCTSLFVAFLLLAGYGVAEEHASDKYICAEPNPEQMCNAGNTCGSASAPCSVDVKRTADAASSTPSISHFKENAPFCVKVGTTVRWQSSSKNTGFVVDFGPSSPFGSDGAVIGGSDRSVSLVAKKQGCFKYSAGACVSGAIYGMCGSVDTELVVTGGGN
jgi:plastocyanin